MEKMTIATFVAHLTRMHACDDVIAWVRNQQADAEAAWAACQRGDWLLWLVDRAGVDHHALVSAACDCAADVTVLAVDSARRRTRGEAGPEEVAVDRAAHAAYVYAARAAYAAAAYADDAAHDGAYAAHAARAAITAYALAAYDDAAHDGAAAAFASLARSAHIVREHITWAMVERGLEAQS